LVQVVIIEGWLSNLKPLKQSGCRTIPFKNLSCRVLQLKRNKDALIGIASIIGS
jgi:hypothetical protein